MRLTPAISALVVSCLALAACGPKGGTTVKLGVAGPITGGQSKNGEDLVDGTKMAVEEWNAKGGVLGKQVEMVVRDDQAKEVNAATVAGQLIDQHVAGVVGHFNSGCTLPASLNYNNAGIVCITPASTNEKVTDRDLPLVFRVCGRDDQQAPAAANYIADVMKAKRVAVLDDRTSYGKGLADNVEKGLQGRAEVVLREGFSKDERNFRPYIAALLEKQVEVWYFGGIYEQAAPFLIQARAAGVKAPMMSGDGVHGYPKDFLEKVGKDAEGTFTTFLNTEGAPGYAAFVERYKKRFEGKEPGPYAMYSYTAASVILGGIEKSASTEGAKIAAAIRSGSFDTPIGKASFDKKGDVVVEGGGYVVWVVKDGRHVLARK
jgi:branched-chain amino acid transport system substrate-binding protein